MAITRCPEFVRAASSASTFCLSRGATPSGPSTPSSIDQYLGSSFDNDADRSILTEKDGRIASLRLKGYFSDSLDALCDDLWIDLQREGELPKGDVDRVAGKVPACILQPPGGFIANDGSPSQLLQPRRGRDGRWRSGFVDDICFSATRGPGRVECVGGQPDRFHRLLVDGQRSGFVAGNVCAASQSFHSCEFPDDDVPPRHTARAYGKSDCHRNGEAFGNC